MSFNPHQWYLMGVLNNFEYNLYIKGVSATITSASLLAAKFQTTLNTTFPSSSIKNFTIEGDWIKCRVTQDYEIRQGTDGFRATNCTDYYDYERCVYVNGSAFYQVETKVFRNFYGKNVLGVGGYAFATFNGGSSLRVVDLPNCTSLDGTNHFFYSNTGGVIKIINIPKVTSIGNTVLNNEVFNLMGSSVKVYAEPTMETINGGGVEGDLATVISNGGSVVYVANYTVPNAITDLSVGTVSGTAIQLIFTPPSSTNTIDFYEVYLDGVYYQNISASGDNIIGLNTDTTYEITVRAVDIYYNKSGVSNKVIETTTL